MICWYCKSLIADNAYVCPCCGVAVTNPVRESVDYPVYEEFRQNGYFNPYEEYYRNFQLPQIMPQFNPSMFGQYPINFGGMQIPQYPAGAMAMPVGMQSMFSPYQVVGVIYPQPPQTEEPKVWVKPNEEAKPEIETLVKDEPVLILEPSEVDGKYSAESTGRSEKTEIKKTEKDKTPVSETEKSKVVGESKKTNVLAVVGFIFAFIIPLIGLILSSIGLSRVKTRDLNGKGLATAGIILSIVMAIVFAGLMVIFSDPLLAFLGL